MSMSFTHEADGAFAARARVSGQDASGRDAPGHDVSDRDASEPGASDRRSRGAGIGRLEAMSGDGAPRDASESVRPARVLLLQGPAGPFFARLAEEFASRGIEATRVRFSPGDRLFAPGAGGDATPRVDYRGTRDEFGPWLRDLIEANGFEMIVMFGDERPPHAIARRVARETGTRVISLEHGYALPGHVAVEREGNDWRSPLAGCLPAQEAVERVRREGDDPILERPEPVKSRGFRWWMTWGGIYFAVRNLLGRRSERGLFHKERPSLHEAPRWARNFWRWARGAGADAQWLIETHPKRFDVVPLQVSDDSQLGDAGRGWDNDRLIEEAVASFAAHAPADRHLAIKVHPLERGHTDAHRRIAALAARHGVADRVHCIMSGPFGALARAARGVILINSTCAISALTHGTPVLVLGDAVYRRPELVRCGRTREDIDRFWTDDFVGEEALRRVYVPWLIAHALVPGDFYDPALMRVTARNVAGRALDLWRHCPFADAPHGDDRSGSAPSEDAARIVSGEDTAQPVARGHVVAFRSASAAARDALVEPVTDGSEPNAYREPDAAREAREALEELARRAKDGGHHAEALREAPRRAAGRF